jgi:hypothetical protein
MANPEGMAIFEKKTSKMAVSVVGIMTTLVIYGVLQV